MWGKNTRLYRLTYIKHRLQQQKQQQQQINNHQQLQYNLHVQYIYVSFCKVKYLILIHCLFEKYTHIFIFIFVLFVCPLVDCSLKAEKTFTCGLLHNYFKEHFACQNSYVMTRLAVKLND